jgi:hypothetical protein
VGEVVVGFGKVERGHDGSSIGGAVSVIGGIGVAAGGEMGAREIGGVDEVGDLVVDVGVRVGEGGELGIEHVEGVGGGRI